ncbi:DUF6877 family protein [Pseudogracilibacillus auburnensis]
MNKLITDWLATEGNTEDPYIEQKLKFAKKYL